MGFIDGYDLLKLFFRFEAWTSPSPITWHINVEFLRS